MYSTRAEVENWLISMNVKNYIINEDLTVDVNGNVDLSEKNINKIPIQFNIIKGDFFCIYNSLTNLKGCPKVVYGGFTCRENKLTSLEGCSEVITGYFSCSGNKLTNLEGCPEIIEGSFDCRNNNIINLKGISKIINGNFNCAGNQLTNLENFPEIITGDFIKINKNKIREEELVNFNCNIKNVNKIYSNFNKYGDKEEFLEKVNYYKIKKENDLLKELSVNGNNVKLNKKL